MRRLRLRTILALLVLATTVPLSLFSAWTIRRSWIDQIEIIDRQSVEQARAVVVAVDQEVERTAAALQVLATLDPIDLNDLPHFTQIATRLIPLHPGWEVIRLVDPAGNVLASTEAPEGHPAPLLTRDWVDMVVRTGRTGVSRIQHDPATGRHVITIGVPVVRQNRLNYVLGARVYSSVFSDILRRQKTPPGGVIALLDQTPLIVARTLNEERYVGERPTPDFVERSRLGIEGAWRTRVLEGFEAHSAFSHSALTAFTVEIGLPAEAVESPIRSSISGLILAGLATLGVGLAFALLLGARVVRGQLKAATAARALAAGKTVPAFTSRIAETADLAAALKDAAEILDLRLQERDEAQWELDRNRAMLLDREQTARRAAESLSRAKDEFVATVSHELRTPLNAIFGWVALLKTGSLDEERRAHALQVIDRNTRAQAQLIEDLLDMSRVIRGDVRLSMNPVDLALVLDAAVDALRPTAAARHIEIIVPTQQGAAVLGDHGRLQQILWNLLANAIKFTPPAGRVQTDLSIEGEEAVVRISDTGEGIAPEFLPHVFDRFRQETADVTRTHSGLGIGLSLVRHLTELHGGRVTAESDGKGHGSTFTVRLPLLGARAGEVDAAPVDPTPLGGTRLRPLEGLHILVVDDEADGRDLIATALRQAGARVTTAGSGNEALEILRGELLDVIVADIAMANGSGYDLARAVRAQPATATVPLVAITAYSHPEDRARASAEGFDAHLGKPFDPATLIAMIAGFASRP